VSKRFFGALDPPVDPTSARGRERLAVWLLDRAHALLAAVLDEPINPPLVNLPPEGATLEAIEREAILIAMERCLGVQKDAARLLGVSARVLNYKLAHHRIRRPLASRRRA
jgi:DNA-binding NtrC family response regulator